MKYSRSVGASEVFEIGAPTWNLLERQFSALVDAGTISIVTDDVTDTDTLKAAG